MSLSKELLNRRIPQILVSYFIAGATFILFMDWLVDRYGLAEYYTTMALFGVIAILPSVVILSYFHGAPGKDEWNRIEKIGIPVNMVFIILVFFIGHKANWWFESDYVIENNNYYINFTSSENYLKYYDNYETGYDKRFNSDQFLIESIHDSLLEEIAISVYRSVAGVFSGRGINVDVNIASEESEIFNELYHPVLNPLTDLQQDTLSSKMDEILAILKSNYVHYDDELPNTIIRYFIYAITDLETGEKFYSFQKTDHWGKSLRTHSSTRYTGWSRKYSIDNQGWVNLIEDLIGNAEGQIAAKKYGDWLNGEVIEELDHDLVKIKLYHIGAIREKMRLKTMRRYIWAENGLNIMLEDLMQIVDYLKNTDPKKIWDYGQTRPDSDWANKLEVYDELEFKKEINEAISTLLKHYQELKENTEFYENTDSSNNDFCEYYLEVVSVEDSIAIAKIIGSRQPVYTVREGDFIIISK
tara:strand:- start:240 stop:1652 length:1413 start_codon:yes stop_codon:yes gene_type:complete